jgi:UDP-N-acetylmuramoyl-L-alanyl-D-glutamate--2,6-diaminopimelate ligase
LITVFGCGGDRDRTKRPLMGEIAARLSDFCVVTSDNPRSEEPEAIIAEIVQGLEKVDTCRYAIIPDRREAIRHAIFLARKGDLV